MHILHHQALKCKGPSVDIKQTPQLSGNTNCEVTSHECSRGAPAVLGCPRGLRSPQVLAHDVPTSPRRPALHSSSLISIPSVKRSHGFSPLSERASQSVSTPACTQFYLNAFPLLESERQGLGSGSASPAIVPLAPGLLPDHGSHSINICERRKLIFNPSNTAQDTQWLHFPRHCLFYFNILSSRSWVVDKM